MALMMKHKESKALKRCGFLKKHGLIWGFLDEIVTTVNKKILVSCIQKGLSYNLVKFI